MPLARTSAITLIVERINSSPPDYEGVWMSGSRRANGSQPITLVNLGSVLYGTTRHEGGWGNNNTGYWSQEWADLVAEINTTVDQETLKGLYSRMNDIMLEDAWILTLGSLPSRQVVVNGIEGVRNKYGEDGFEWRGAYFA